MKPCQPLGWDQGLEVCGSIVPANGVNVDVQVSV